jgi:hypothetical protein
MPSSEASILVPKVKEAGALGAEPYGGIDIVTAPGIMPKVW